jgi:hypothetical protein
MSINSAFQAMGKTYKANATTSSQTITVTADAPCTKLCVANHQPTGTGGQPVYFLVSSNSAVTITTPVAGTPSYCLVSVPGTIKTFQIPGQVSANSSIYIAFISEGTSECYFTPGEGL